MSAFQMLTWLVTFPACWGCWNWGGGGCGCFCFGSLFFSFSSFTSTLLFLLLQQGLIILPWLANLLCRLGWPRAHRDLLAFSTLLLLVLRLKAFDTVPSFALVNCVSCFRTSGGAMFYKLHIYHPFIVPQIHISETTYYLRMVTSAWSESHFTC